MTYNYATALGLIAAVSLVYAIILRMEDWAYHGRVASTISLWKSEHTWQTVVVGVGYTLLLMTPCVGSENAKLWFGAFAVGGSFMGLQSILGNISRANKQKQRFNDDDLPVR